MENDVQSNDRRKKQRFAMDRQVRYKLLEGDTIVAYGAGQTIDLGSGGVAFTATQRLTLGAFVELSISWPVLLDEATPMRLVVYGKVLRSVPGRAVCTINKFEFRTQSRAAEARPLVRTDSIFQRWVDSYRKETLRAQATA
jgi:hypothetical protein